MHLRCLTSATGIGCLPYMKHPPVLGSLISDYFDTCEDQADLLEAQQRGLEYQKSVVLPYHEASTRTNQLN